MTRGQFLLPLACLLVLGCAVFVLRAPPVPARVLQKKAVEGSVVAPASAVKVPGVKTRSPGPAIARKSTSATESLIVEVAVDDASHRPEPPPLPETVLGASTLKLSSWENPFSPELWTSFGWEFSADGMQTINSAGSDATFARPYRKLMLEFDITAAGPHGSWELRLANQNAPSVMSFVVHNDQISVIATERDVKQTVLEKPLPALLSPTRPRRFRIVATGNRIVISWDGRRLLAAEQLASQSGHDIIWSMHTRRGAFQVSRLRVEGD